MMITNILKRASALVVAFFLIACSSQSYEATVASVNDAVVEAACTQPTLSELRSKIEEAGGTIAHEFKGTDALILVAMHNRLGGTDFKADAFYVARREEAGAVILTYKNCVVDVVFASYADIMLHVTKELKGRSA